MENYNIRDAFKALENIDVEDTPVKKLNKLEESVKKHITKLQEGYVGQSLEDFFDTCTETSTIESITVSNNGVDDYDKSIVANGVSFDELGQGILEASFADFDCGGDKVTIKTSSDGEGFYYETIEDFIGDYNGDGVAIWDLDQEKEVFSGDKSDIPDNLLSAPFNSFDAPTSIYVNISDYEPDEENESYAKKEEAKPLKEEPIKDLDIKYDSRNSFYGKAKVDYKNDGTQVLYSYGTPVCRIKDGKATLLRKGYLGWSSSPTTLRHVKEFLQQNGFKIGSYKELAKMYPVEQAALSEKAETTTKSLNEKAAFDFVNAFFNDKQNYLENGDIDSTKLETALSDSKFDKDLLDWIVKESADLGDDGYDYEEFVALCGHYKPATLKEEKSFNLMDDKAVDSAKAMIADDKETEQAEQIVDVDASNLENLKSSYVGQLVLECPVCKEKRFLEPDQLVKSEETTKEGQTLYNDTEACSHCGEKGGFILVGQISKVDSEEAKEDTAENKEEEEETLGGEEAEKGETSVESETTEEEAAQPVPAKENKTESIVNKPTETKAIVEDVDEKTFNGLVTEYLKQVYEDVDSFELTKGSVDGKTLIFEGKINFINKHTQNTKFVFETKIATHKGNVEFIGLNEAFSKDKAFTLQGKLRNNCLVCSNLKYKYNSQGQLIEGLIKTNKEIFDGE